MDTLTVLSEQMHCRVLFESVKILTMSQLTGKVIFLLFQQTEKYNTPVMVLSKEVKTDIL